MKVGRHIWWIVSGLCLLLCVGFILAVYQFGWSRTGFLNKSLWDWLQLLIVPLVLAIVALVFQIANTRTEQQIAKQRYEQDQQIALDKQREDLLQAYLDRMSELLLEKNLRTSPTDEVRNVALVRTTTVLCQLVGRRVGYVFGFLRAAGLMSEKSNDSILSLSEADLSLVNWSQAHLSGASLSGADLSGAYLARANLSHAILIDTDLSGADLSGADLRGANLSRANLNGADLRGAKLDAFSRMGANFDGVAFTEDDVFISRPDN